MNTIVALFASVLTLVSPENGAEYDTHTPCVKEFLASYDEYEISSLCRNLPRFRYGRKFGGLLSELSGDTALYGAKTVRENAEKYFLKIGVPQAEIDAVRDIMIEK